MAIVMHCLMTPIDNGCDDGLKFIVARHLHCPHTHVTVERRVGECNMGEFVSQAVFQT